MFGVIDAPTARRWCEWFFVCTILAVRITFDPAKNARNITERGLSFEEAAHFAFESALFAVDERKEYPETRYVAIGLLGDRLHVLCFSETVAGIRVISLRKANAREVKRYAQVRTTD
jgi:uncharacterized protein